MQPTDLSTYRVLVVGARTHGLNLLCAVLGLAGVGKVLRVPDTGRALRLLSKEHFTAVFCEPKTQANGRSFVLVARCDRSVINRMLPIFVLQERAHRSDVERLRDSGATDILTTPISPRTVAWKLVAATKAPRPFILADAFFGPDRRAKARPVYHGSERRSRSTRKLKRDLLRT